MRRLVRLVPGVICAVALTALAMAQQPGGRAKEEPAKDKKDYSEAPIVVKMMAFNKKKDGKLLREEVTDERLLRLFDLADTNKDGVVTREELMALAAKLDADAGRTHYSVPKISALEDLLKEVNVPACLLAFRRHASLAGVALE
jgi:hypothetical protein